MLLLLWHCLLLLGISYLVVVNKCNLGLLRITVEFVWWVGGVVFTFSCPTQLQCLGCVVVVLLLGLWQYWNTWYNQKAGTSNVANNKKWYGKREPNYDLFTRRDNFAFYSIKIQLKTPNIIREEKLRGKKKVQKCRTHPHTQYFMYIDDIDHLPPAPYHCHDHSLQGVPCYQVVELLESSDILTSSHSFQYFSTLRRKRTQQRCCTVSCLNCIIEYRII